MAKQKKEKQIPIKQQMYEQMITSQLYGDQSPTSQANLDKIQKTYDEWQNTKATTAKIQEHYNAWLDERKKAKEATSAPKSEIKKVAEPAQKATKSKEKKTYLLIPMLCRALISVLSMQQTILKWQVLSKAAP